ncbi:hypothetical protein [Nocardiopsis deserti]|uniref:hypothetical protein n=1 Tax=Nocardiopsis deserti TaxID=2605988 RepID=UPI001680B2F1|nr:hypothetical protein [Nocardiopsis deserti]
MFHSELLNANAREMTEQRVREMEHLRTALRIRAEERARRGEERRERQRQRRSYGRAA